MNAYPTLPTTVVSSHTLVHVLVAEDEPDIRELLVMLLEEEGYSVTAVGDGQAAVDAIAQSDFGLAVLDVTMPIMDGLTAAKTIKAMRPALPIVLHTAMEEGWIRERFTGYHALVGKPMDPGIFGSSLARLLS